MGGTESKTVIATLSEVVNNVAMSTVQSCEVDVAQNQSLVVNNTGVKLWGSYKLEQTSEIMASCFSDVSKQAELQNSLIQAISQATSATGLAVLDAFGKTKSEAAANLSNTIKNNVTMYNIQRSYNAIKQRQSAVFNNSGIVGYEKGELTQGSKIFAAATLQEMDKAGIFNKIEEHIDQKSTAKTENPLDFLAKMIGAIGGSMMGMVALFVFILVVAIGAIVLVVRGFSSGDTGDSGRPAARAE
jgi:hypothetical protein